ncbi:SUMF1/EgtB/PvdO family nonheme iron enzyme [Desulfoluna sp.]|uniref:formylglycine-generating enzyme family protein n=1 Tax=Desulfoluna sp. TaxID=2045199 RepID=UPI002639030B|nr:SUMF1/EgtB/PvdO family nonheme iron enzyme [Desulfoluna sp.]
MTTIRLIPCLCLLFYSSAAFSHGLVLFPFDAPGRPEAEVSFFQETLATHLTTHFRLFEGEGVEAALSLCREETRSITDCLALVGEVFEADMGVRGRWAAPGGQDAFFLEIIDLETGSALFSGRDMDRRQSVDRRFASLARRAYAHMEGPSEATMTVMPGMDFFRIPGDPMHPVYLQVSEVTQAQWRMVMGYNPSWFITCGEDCPVDSVTREEIDTFLMRMNIIGRGRFRLPTFKEWQRALAVSEDEAPCFMGNNCVAYGGYPCDQWPAGGSECSRCGPRAFSGRGARIENMTGNVWEWLTAPEDGDGSFGLLVGGGWADSPQASGGILRPVSSSRFAADDVGFRLLLEGESSQPTDTH